MSAIYVAAERREWSSMVRAGLRAATGDHLVVLDVGRHYSPQSLTEVIAPVRTGHCDVAVAVPRHDGPDLLAAGGAAVRGSGMISRLVLGTSDVFSGLFALERSVWDRAGSNRRAGKSPVLDSLLRRPARCIDVKVGVDDHFRVAPGPLLGSSPAQARSRQPIRQLLAARPVLHGRRLGNGRRPDLLRALAVALLVHVARHGASRRLFGGTWHLAIAAALAIAIALVWNFTLNRRLTFNDASEGLARRGSFSLTRFRTRWRSL